MRSISSALICLPSRIPGRQVGFAGRAVRPASNASSTTRCIHPQTEEMPHHWQKLRVEEEIFRSGLPFTSSSAMRVHAERACLPGTDSDNMPVCRTLQRPRAFCTGRSWPTLPRSRQGFSPNHGHAGAIYELAGPANLSSEEIAYALADPSCGNRLRPFKRPLDSWERSAIAQVRNAQ